MSGSFHDGCAGEFAEVLGGEGMAEDEADGGGLGRKSDVVGEDKGFGG